MRALGVDLGSKRIGLAVSDFSGTIASPHSVLLRSNSWRKDHEAIRRIVVDEEVEIVIVGLPLTLAGQTGPAAQGVIDEVRQLSSVVGVPVELVDERLTTVAADRILREGDLSATERRRHVDKIAAAVLLQSWLDGRERS
ncbi:MAG: Holliday junction resolvase RuvX [Actinomycetota bacterium]